MMYIWWSLCASYSLACQVRATIGDSGLCYCCICVTSFKRGLTPLCDYSVDSFPSGGGTGREFPQWGQEEGLGLHQPAPLQARPSVPGQGFPPARQLPGTHPGAQHPHLRQRRPPRAARRRLRERPVGERVVVSGEFVLAVWNVEPEEGGATPDWFDEGDQVVCSLPRTPRASFQLTELSSPFRPTGVFFSLSAHACILANTCLGRQSCYKQSTWAWLYFFLKQWLGASVCAVQSASLKTWCVRDGVGEEDITAGSPSRAKNAETPRRKPKQKTRPCQGAECVHCLEEMEDKS